MGESRLRHCHRSQVRHTRRAPGELGKGSVLLSRQFDREGVCRVPYLSDASLLSHDSWGAADYADIAGVIRDHGAASADDLRQLWRRMAFLVAVNSTDDHLRNHGFVWNAGGWAPLEDVRRRDHRKSRTQDLQQRRVAAAGDGRLAAGVRRLLRGRQNPELP
ncbi:MAG: HipA domain-containing protein [Actinobacteria bacterium]|nr:HipA domain-containing protein [Actinomycetota bacterium]